MQMQEICSKQTRTRNPYVVAGVSLLSSCVNEYPQYAFHITQSINSTSVNKTETNAYAPVQLYIAEQNHTVNELS